MFIFRERAIGVTLGLTALAACVVAPRDSANDAAGEEESPVVAPQVVYSTSPDRAAPQPLHGAAVAGKVYVFATPDPGTKQVRFWLDAASPAAPTGTPAQTENTAPYDLRGTAADGSAVAFDPLALGTGTHSLTAQATMSDGSTRSLGTASFTVSRAEGAMGPLVFDPNHRFHFKNAATGAAVYLTGSHVHHSLQDAGKTNPPAPFDFAQYLAMVTGNGHNFFRLWAWEHPRGDAWVSALQKPTYYSPVAYARTGPGLAKDGLPKFDLGRFNQAYFDRMRERVLQAKSLGIYVGVMLYQGCDERPANRPANQNPWDTHPFNAANNVNGIDGDPSGDAHGYEIHEWPLPAGVWARQQAYVRKVVDTVNDLDNVIYEVGNEHHAGSSTWQNEVAKTIKAYEAGKPVQHPVGITALLPNQGTMQTLVSNVSDWMSPSSSYWDPDDPPIPTASKVVLSDTDHFFPWPTGGHDRSIVWKAFTRGNNPIGMDAMTDTGTTRLDLRRAMGRTLALAKRVDLGKMTPASAAAECSTTYLLREPGRQYIAYHPGGASMTLQLPAGTYAYEYHDAVDASMNAGTFVQTAAGTRTIARPSHASADWIVYLRVK